MKILVVSQYFWPENFRINDLVSELVQRDHEVTVLTGYPNYPAGNIFPAFRNDPESYNNYRNARVVRVPLIPRGKGGIRLVLNYISFVLSAAVLGWWRLKKQAFDVIFVFEPSPITVGLPAVLLKKIKRAPVVFWVLDLWPETLSAIGVVRSSFLLSLVGRMVRFIYRNCDLVLGQSKGFVDQIAEYCTDRKKIKYFPSWAEDIFDKDSTELALEVEVKQDVFNVLFAGNIGEAQDFSAILDAAEQLKEEKNICWLIVGDGRKSGWVKAEVEKRGLQGSFVLLGRFPVERMPSFYNHAQALLVTLKPDPFLSLTIPGKVQSYLMSGLPILGMLDGEGATVIGEAGAGIVCRAGDGAELAAAVRKISRMPSHQRYEMGMMGKKYAMQEFDRCSLIDRLENWMETVALR